MIAAIIPAAGRSVRMGRPKLLLDIGGQSLIGRVVAALKEGGAERVVVVTAPVEQEGAAGIALLAREAGASAIHLETPTADMRATIERGMEVLESTPASPMGILIAPGDSVGLSAALVRAVVEQFLSDPSRIVVPVRDGSRGHPVALPWSIALTIRDLPRDAGVNRLLVDREADVDRLPVEDPGLNADLDTPEDYRRWCAPRQFPIL